jgi:hypothetical protein
MDLLHTLLPLTIGMSFIGLAIVEGCVPHRLKARAVARALHHR